MENLGKRHGVGQISQGPEYSFGERILMAISRNTAISVQLPVELSKHGTHHARAPSAGDIRYGQEHGMGNRHRLPGRQPWGATVRKEMERVPGPPARRHSGR